MIKSPCVGICTATAFGDEICRGCGRTFEEVIKWNQLSDAEKAKIIEIIQRSTKYEQLGNGSQTKILGEIVLPRATEQDLINYLNTYG